MTQSERPLSTTELDRLEKLLVSDIFHEEAMPLDMLQGLLCAVASAPDIISPSNWLPVALGENPVYETPAQAEEILDLVGEVHHGRDCGGVGADGRPETRLSRHSSFTMTQNSWGMVCSQWPASNCWRATV